MKTTAVPKRLRNPVKKHMDRLHRPTKERTPKEYRRRDRFMKTTMDYLSETEEKS